ncbi:RseA family anti-sigma factor [Gammaproteobacteria bacterium]|nr:RseA family anti-sigma factor [Gammaproteobacteria bacterium]MDB2611605.1 RseA family anti-sigma factor [Gammaproteobacteria bacterium]
MDKDLEKLSALYDGELSYKEIQEGLDKMREDQGLKETFHKFGLISELVQRQTKQNTSKLLFFKDYLIKVNPVMSNLFTATATVLITLIILYQFDDDRFQVDRESSLQLSSAISSDEAKSQLLDADQNIMEHMIHIMQSNSSHSSQQISKNWIPVGFSVNPTNPNQYSNGRNNLFFHLENKQLGIKKVKYFKANNNWIYLIPLQDGKLLTAYGDIPPSVANPMIQSIYQRN